ncbi:MAG: glycosyltransferase N-terminal domain-containing protein [Dissulfuribacterales bacterium]
MPKISRILLIFYKICYVIGPVLLLFLRFYAFFVSKHRKRIEAQFSPPPPPWSDVQTDVPVFWVHALSVGEVRAAMPLVEGLLGKWPDARVLLSASTHTGMDTWKTWLNKRVNQDVSECAIFLIPAPFDFPCIIRRFRRMYAPHLMIFVETDIWPNWIWDFRDNGIPSILVNGAISSRSAERLSYLKPVANLLYGELEVISMQSEDDRLRLLSLGLSENRVLCLGNLKQAIQINTLSDSQQAELRRSLGIENERIWIAGSTHAPEEDICLRVHAELISAVKALKGTTPTPPLNTTISQPIMQLPDLKLILAPRDVKRAPEIAELARQAGLIPCLRSSYRFGTPYDVLILNTLGELASIYALADVAFVGGSIAPVGGHNLLEPAVHGVPVLFGRHVESCADVARRLLESGGGFECDENSMEGLLFQLLIDEDLRKKAAAEAKRTAVADGDIVNRHIKLIEAVLYHASFH